MKLKALFIGAVAGLLVGLSHQACAQQPAITIQVLLTFDYPGTGNSTTATGINDQGDVAGYFEDTSGAVRSFIRFRNGTFSAPIVEPNDTGNFTVATDIDNTGRVCGSFFSADIFHPYRGFFLSGSTFTEYGPSSLSTFVSGLTDAGDFCGSQSEVSSMLQGLLVLADGRGEVFGIGNRSEANAINVHRVIVGDYVESDLSAHGYFLDSPKRFIFPIDFPGSTSTILLGLNDGGGWIVGKYVDSSGATHGLLLQRPNTFVSFDYPGATETSLNGINNLKLISGYYADASGVRHGFIARVGSR